MPSCFLLGLKCADFILPAQPWALQGRARCRELFRTPQSLGIAEQVWPFKRCLLTSCREEKASCVSVSRSSHCCTYQTHGDLTPIPLGHWEWPSSTWGPLVPSCAPWFQLHFPSCGTELAWEFLREFPALRSTMKRNVSWVPGSPWQRNKTPGTLTRVGQSAAVITEQPSSPTARSSREKHCAWPPSVFRMRYLSQGERHSTS